MDEFTAVYTRGLAALQKSIDTKQLGIGAEEADVKEAEDVGVSEMAQSEAQSVSAQWNALNAKCSEPATDAQCGSVSECAAAARVRFVDALYRGRVVSVKFAVSA